MMEGGEEYERGERGSGEGRNGGEGDRDEERKLESFFDVRAHRLTWRWVSVHSDSADGEQSVRVACELGRDLAQTE